MTILEPLLETTVDPVRDGVRLSVRGELSPATVPALRSLVEALQERVVQLDLRDAEVAPGTGSVLERWGLTAGELAGIYVVP